jgi:hypothetical protein
MAYLIEDNAALNRVLLRLRLAQLKEVEMGSMDASQHSTFDGTVSALATMYELGFTTESGKDVIASFMQPADYSARQSQSNLNNALRQMVPLLMRGNISITDIFGEVGSVQSNEYRQYILDNKVQLRRDGHVVSKPEGTRLIETGELEDSIDYEVR